MISERIGVLDKAFREMLYSSYADVDTLPPGQVVELRRAFFGGAMTCLKEIKDSDSFSEGFNTLTEELENFWDEMQRGEA